MVSDVSKVASDVRNMASNVRNMVPAVIAGTWSVMSAILGVLPVMYGRDILWKLFGP